MQTVNLAEKLDSIREYWSPKVVGAVNEFHVKLVALGGEFVWHAREAEDEPCLVLEGVPRMQFRGGGPGRAPGTRGFRYDPQHDRPTLPDRPFFRSARVHAGAPA